MQRPLAWLRLLAVDVGDEAQVALAAHRAVVVDRLADVAAGPEQLGVGVADVEAGRRAPAPEVAQHGSPGERVVDVTLAHGAAV